jgi:Fe-S-cluster containining protein
MLVKPPVTEEEKNAIIEAGFDDYFLYRRHGIYDIKTGMNSRCPYLKNDNSCLIHDVKPILCRIWPVIPRIKNNKRSFIIIKCPLFPHLSKEDIIQAKKEAETIPVEIIQHLWAISKEMKEKYKLFDYEKI